MDQRSYGRSVCLLVVLLLAFSPFTAADEAHHRERRKPIVLDRSGGFVIGGVVKKNPSRFGRNTTLSCDHGYMEYFIPWNPRRTSLVMWHSSSTQVWQNRWDGGEGFKDMFLRRDYPVYLWDAPRVGRAAWSCDPTRYRPSYQDQSNFNSWNFGPSYGTWWPDVQFPVNDTEAWQQATSSRYQEYDTFENVQLQARAAAVAADSGKVGNSIVYLTNSAAGLRAQLTATRSNTTNIKGIVAYESIGYVFPDNLNMTQSNRSGFGPVVVPLADFKKLAKLRGIQFVWGDHKGANDTYVAQSKRVAQLINSYGGNATVVMLGEIAGLKGSTHIPFADLSNDKVAGLLERFLRRTWLDGYVDGSKGRKHWR